MIQMVAKAEKPAVTNWQVKTGERVTGLFLRFHVCILIVYVKNYLAFILFRVTVFNCSETHLRHPIYEVVEPGIWWQLSYELLYRIALGFGQIHI